ncbi:MAG TPA: lipoyl synthase [Candidatus Nanoarchaeia archaeon]|nr:lipoyl synthase [Candidatus Nanoarchaeia archaeon]
MKPDWLKVKIPLGGSYVKLKSLVTGSTHTICEEAKCPNLAECWGRGTATFLILGDYCTRNCPYCDVKHGIPLKVDPHEPEKVANIIKEMGIRYAVITSVTRDDLQDGGARMFKKTITAIKKIAQAKVEVLTPDFRGNIDSIKSILAAEPDVFAHNIETVERLFPTMRPGYTYNQSLQFLKNIKEMNPKQATKSSIMLGLGEIDKEVIKTMRALRFAKVDILTLGQYLQPSKDHTPVLKYYTPEEFSEFKRIGYELGFSHVESGPLVRSSYHAEDAVHES